MPSEAVTARPVVSAQTRPPRPCHNSRLDVCTLAITMNPQDAWKRLSQQLQRASSSGGGGGRLPVKGFFTGTGLLLALVGGGVALNASLFNGALAFT